VDRIEGIRMIYISSWLVKVGLGGFSRAISDGEIVPE
jgi:hypothetical protein